MNIPFNKPYMTGKVLWYIALACAPGRVLAGHAGARFLAAGTLLLVVWGG